jgi:hypothetical protein
MNTHTTGRKMMKKSAGALRLILLLVAGCTAQWLMAQQSSPAVDRPAEPNFAFDDDGGKAQIVPRGPAATAATAKKYHGGAVMKSIQQVTIFLGEGWAKNDVRVREAALGDLLVNNGGLAAALEAQKIKTSPATPTADDFSAVNEVNDLAIQRKLAQMLDDKAIPPPTASTIYVVYLGPGVNSTLGGLKGGVNYAAYHNIVHLNAGEVRYVVVPFDADTANQRTAASRAFTEAGENPHLIDGWF